MTVSLLSFKIKNHSHIIFPLHVNLPSNSVSCDRHKGSHFKTNQISCIRKPPKSQSHCVNGLYNLYSEQHPLSIGPHFEWGKMYHIDKKEKIENNLRKSHRGQIPLPGQTDMQKMPHVQNRTTKSQFTNCIGRNYLINMWSVWIQETTEQHEASPSGARATRPLLHPGARERAGHTR